MDSPREHMLIANRVLPFTVAMLIMATVLVGCVQFGGQDTKKNESIVTKDTNRDSNSTVVTIEEEMKLDTMKRVDFSAIDDTYRFSATIPSSWNVEHIASIDSINIYDPADSVDSSLEKSQFFIRFFEASSFLTLSTVEIFDQTPGERNGHATVSYDIEKNPGVRNFSSQPTWRSERHLLTDFRYTENSPSLFYVFAYNPSLSPDKFEEFLQSLAFHNDEESFVAPLDQASDRITKKSFGLEVAPDNSPVQPERFTGFHTAVDMEVISGELTQDVPVKSFCGGKLRHKRDADGYGGVVVQECLIGDQIVTVVYGHLKLSSIDASVGSYIAPGTELGFLGAHESDETDGERKHLHFGVHKGSNIDIRGYVPSESQLVSWLDPQDYL